jgi:hypothetical protein
MGAFLYLKRRSLKAAQQIKDLGLSAFALRPKPMINQLSNDQLVI